MTFADETLDAVTQGPAVRSGPLTFLPEGSVVNGRYQVTSMLGRGGMGTVYRVVDALRPQLPLVLKTLSTADAPQSLVDRLKAEFRIMAGLRHPNVARVYDFEAVANAEANVGHVITMELIEGETLDRAAAGASIERIAELLVPICRALRYIHRRGLVHFDLKPQNVMVTYDGTVKVLDFGVAAVARRSSPALTPKGTREFMAPEVLDVDAPVDHRADLYALGVTARRLLGGLAVPGWMEALVASLCAPDPSDRPPSADAVIDRINADGGFDFAVETPETLDGYVFSTPFVGREGALDTVIRFVEGRAGAQAGHEPVLLVSGRSGVGKSRLLEEARYTAQLSDIGWREGSCYEGSLSDFGPLTDCAREIATALAAFGQDRMLERYAEMLDALDLGASRHGGVELDKGAVLAEFLVEAAQIAPYVLYVNDLQWARPATVDVLLRVAERLRFFDRDGRPVPLGVIVTFRSDEIAGTSGATLTQTDGTQRLALAPLAPEDTERLVASMLGTRALPEGFGARIAGATAGNPFFCEEMLRALIDASTVFSDGRRWSTAVPVDELSLPATVGDALTARVANVPDADREIVELMSALGRPTDTGLLAVASGRSEDHLEAALARLVGARLIACTVADQTTYRVAHDQVRHAVYRGLDDERRRAAHLAITRGIEAVRKTPDAFVELLAEQSFRSGDEQRAFEYAVKAADAALARHEAAAGAEYLSRARELMGGEGVDTGRDDRELADELDERIADANALLGNYNEAIAIFRRLRERHTGIAALRMERKVASCIGDSGRLSKRELELLMRAAERAGERRIPRSKVGRLAETATALVRLEIDARRERKVSGRGTAADVERAQILVNCVESAFFADPELAFMLLPRALAAAVRLGVSPELAHANAGAGTILAVCGMLEASRVYVARAEANARELGRVWYMGFASAARGALDDANGRYASAVERLRAGLDMMLACGGGVFYIGMTYYFLADSLMQLGQIEEATSVIADGVQRLGDTQSVRFVSSLIALDGVNRAFIGGIENAREDLHRAVDMSTQSRDVTQTAHHLLRLGEAELRVGDVDEAVRHLEDSIEVREIHDVTQWWEMRAYPLLARALYRRDGDRVDVKRVRQLTKKGLRLANRRPYCLPDALAGAALAAELEGRYDDAGNLLGRAEDQAAVSGARITAALIGLDRVRLLRRQGRASADLHRRQIEILEQCGATRLAEIVSAV